jgi:hypothetical protein
MTSPSPAPRLELTPLPTRQLSLADLDAQAAVLDCINRLFIGTDRKDWDAVRECLAERVHFDMTSLAGGSPAVMTGRQIAETWAAGLAPIQAIHHQAGNYRVEVRGEEAGAFCYATATHYRKTRSGRNVRTFVGSYDFGLRRIGGVWRIEGFRFSVKYVEGNLELEKD